ncbi:uncharacterized protein LOC142332820 isoform X2 [Lycorma delicatula]
MTVTSASSSRLNVFKNEGNKMNHTSPLRPSILGGGCASTSASSSSSVFGASVCSPTFSSLTNNFPRNLFSKSCTRPMENRSPSFHKPVLRPSQLANPGLADSSTKSSNLFVLNPPKLANPFAKTNSTIDEPNRSSSDGDNPLVKVNKSLDNASKTQDNVVTSTAAGQLDEPQQQQQQQQQGCSKTSSTPMAFVPLSTPNSSTPNTPVRLPSTSASTHSNTPTTTPGFVFGQNLHERVIVEPSGSEAGACSSSDIQNVTISDAVTPSTASAATNGTSTEMLFTSVIQKELLPDKTMEGNSGLDDKGRKSLSESAREYEESRAVKRKYEEVAVVTGEEEENNILQMDCKLFVYDGSKFNYSEGVHGSLRVNDPPVTAKKVTQSRVIVRMSGTLRVLMNTKIWAGMKIEKPNRKIVRMTAMDSIGQIKVFLISSSPAESDLLYRVLDSRIRLQNELIGACHNGNLEDKADSTQ